ncbi:MAG: phosphoglycolate phosphatase [Notoacmeibacter sp.]|nr:phosphoglycolate phosphatase [Notoacmeibacter sp.]
MKPVILFDLDGTLVDTSPDLLDAVDVAIAADGLSPVNRATMRGYTGHGGRAMLERAFQLAGRHLATERREELLAIFLDHYTASMPGNSRPFDGAIEAMDRLAEAGHPLAICTNKMEALAVRLIDSLGLADRFAAICGADTFGWRKPDPRHITLTIKQAGGDPALGVMIGDTRTDIDAAKAAGIPVVAVAFGYSPEPLPPMEPSCIIRHFDELTPDLAARLLADIA